MRRAACALAAALVAWRAALWSQPPPRTAVEDEAALRARARAALSQTSGEISLPGLQAAVERVNVQIVLATSVPGQAALIETGLALPSPSLDAWVDGTPRTRSSADLEVGATPESDAKRGEGQSSSFARAADLRDILVSAYGADDSRGVEGRREASESARRLGVG